MTAHPATMVEFINLQRGGWTLQQFSKANRRFIVKSRIKAIVPLALNNKENNLREKEYLPIVKYY